MFVRTYIISMWVYLITFWVAVIVMPVIKPISDLRNYNQVLEKVSVGSPVYLTKNGHGCYKFVAKNPHFTWYILRKKYIIYVY